MLNKIRPEMPQISALDDDGCVTVIDCNDYVIGRQSQGQFMNELPLNIFSERLEKIEKIIFDEKKGTRKTLMLTHKIIANKNKYPEVLELLGDDFKDLIDPFLVFFMEKTELIFKGLNENKTNYIFEALGVRQYPINTIADKKKWKYFYEKLEKSRQGTVKDVLDTFNESNFITFPDVIEKIYREYPKNKDERYAKGTVGNLFSIQYSQFVEAIKFHKPDAFSSTNHGVKGEEYDNVIFVVSKGWYHYDFDKYIPMNEVEKRENLSAYKRNRNLFYVCCSRAKKNFVLFITYPVTPKFKDYLKTMVGQENYYSYDEFIKKHN